VCEIWDIKCCTPADCTGIGANAGWGKDCGIYNSQATNNKCYKLKAFTKPYVGDTGDEFGIMIWNKFPTQKITGIRVGKRVIANTDCVQAPPSSSAVPGTANTLTV
jgi:hypothetical protein